MAIYGVEDMGTIRVRNEAELEKIAKVGRIMRTAKPRSVRANLKAMVQPSLKVEMTLPVNVVSKQSIKSHWAAQYRTKKAQQNEVVAWWKLMNMQPSELLALGGQLLVTLTRLGSGSPMDDDNLQHAFKHVRDQLAICLGVSTKAGVGDELIDWKYGQDTDGPVGIRVTIERRPT